MEINPQDYTLTQMREWLKRLNLKSTGNKNELALRLSAVPLDERRLAPDIVEDEEHENDSNDEYGEASGIGVDTNESQLREIKLLQREKEVLRRENEVLKKFATLNVRSVDDVQQMSDADSDSMQAPLSLIKEIVPEYDGDSSFEFWANQVRSVGRTYKLHEKLLRVIVSNKLTGKARKWLHTNVNLADCCIEDLLTVMADVFGKKENKVSLRRQFEARKWKVGESFSEYLTEKSLLANVLKMEEQEFVDYAIEGVPDTQLRTQAYLQCFSTKAQLLQGLSKVSLKSSFNLRQPIISASGEKMDVRCYNCNSIGHMAKDCKKPKRSYGACYACGKTDHLVNTCPERKNMVGLVESDEYVRFFSYKFMNNCYSKSLSLETLIDSGSPISFIKISLVPRIGKFFRFNSKNNNNSVFYGINKSKLKSYGKIACVINFEEKKMELTLIVVADESMSFQVVLGRDFLHKSNSKIVFGFSDSFKKNCCCKNKIVNCTINESCTREDNNDAGGDGGETFGEYRETDFDFEKSLFAIDCTDNVCQKRSDFNVSNIRSIEECLSIVNDKESEYEENRIDVKALSESIIVGEWMPYKIKENLMTLVREKYIEQKSPSKPKISYEMKLTLNEPKPFSYTPRRISYTERVSLQKLLDEYLVKGFIRPSESEFASPIVLIKKKTGDMRMCVDFRKLNKITAKDNFPIPLIDDLLDKVAKKKLFTKLDLKNAFFHVKMHTESVRYTSFVTPLGQFEFLVMPFGLKNAPSVFQRFVHKVFEDMLRDGKVIIYLDDIMIATESVEEHLFILNAVLGRLVENKLQLRLDKCEFMQTDIKFLGYRITSDGIRADDKGLEAIQNFPIPNKVQSVQSFLGLCSYFRRFVKDFSTIAKPLHDLTKKNVPFIFGETELNCFDLLKAKLLEAPVLGLYDPNAETELHCDASALGFGAILLQKKEDGKFHPIFYFSKRTTPVESKYHSFELETLAIIYALRRFRIYLFGKQFKIITDCNSLTLTLNKKEINPRIARWALELENFDYILEHRNNHRMQHVDALSRCTTILVVESNKFEENLVICQNRDVKLKKLREELENAESNLYEMRNGVIYRKKDHARLLFYVPEEMEQQVILKHHDELGHVGIDKTVDSILKGYWFPKLKEKVAQHILNCLKCIVFSSKQGKTEGFLHSVPKGNKPFEMIHVDHYGPIDPAVKIKKHIFVIIDAFSKFVRLYCTKTTNSKEVILALSDYFRAYSRPSYIVSDRGSCFTSIDFDNFLKENNVEHIKIATASPQANGQVERINRSIGPMLAKLINSDSGIHWNDVVEAVEFSLNNTLNRAIGCCPSLALFGVTQKGQISDTLQEELSKINNFKTPSIEEIRNSVVTKQKKLQNYNEEYFNRKRQKPNEYKVGDYVMIKNFDTHKGVARKLIPKFKGPYQIEKVLRNDRYLLRDVDGFQHTQMPYVGVWAVSNIRPWMSKKQD